MTENHFGCPKAYTIFTRMKSYFEFHIKKLKIFDAMSHVACRKEPFIGPITPYKFLLKFIILLIMKDSCITNQQRIFIHKIFIPITIIKVILDELFTSISKKSFNLIIKLNW